MSIIWSKRFSVGVDGIDAQHKGLIDMINLLHADMGKKDVSDDINLVIVNLTKYAREHFHCEEKLMKFVEYPRFHLHVKEHAKMSSNLQALLVRLKKGEQPTARQLFSMLQTWWVSHVEQEDMKYARWIKMRQDRGDLGAIKEMCDNASVEKAAAV